MLPFKGFLLSEGVHDPAKLKAIFLAGGPGSGKSTVVDKVRGDLGYKTVNSDDIFEKGMKKAGLDPKMPESEREKRDVVRSRAKELTAKRAAAYQKGRLGMVIDGTGKDFDEIKKKSEHLRSLGYDTHMIFVNTSLDVAHKRNKARARSVPDDVVTHSWHKVQDNMGKFQQHFGPENFNIIDNSEDTPHSRETMQTVVGRRQRTSPDSEAIKNLHKKIRNISTKEVQNPAGKEWIRSNLQTQKTKAKKSVEKAPLPPVENKRPEGDEAGFKPHTLDIS